MRLNSPFPRAVVTVVALTSTALALTGCGGGSSDSGTGGNAGGSTSTPLPSVSADQALADRVPADIASDGVITVGSDTTYAPSEFLAEQGYAYTIVDAADLAGPGEVNGPDWVDEPAD